MKFKNIETSDLPRIKSYIETVSCLHYVDFIPQILYIYKDKYNYSYAIENDSLFIRFINPINKEFVFYAPIGGDFVSSFNLLLEFIETNNLKKQIYIVAQEQINLINKDILNLFDIFNDRDNANYLYSVSELRELKGNKFNSKRRLVNNFIKQYDGDFKIEKIDLNDLDNLLTYVDKWQITSHENSIDVDYEKQVVLKLIKNSEVLQSFGIKFLLKNELVGFTLGCFFEDQFVQNFEKLDHSIHGLYQISTHFLSTLIEDPNIKYINKEDDVGLYGLRKSKLSYHPIELIEPKLLIAKSYQNITISVDYNINELANLFFNSFADDDFNNFFFQNEMYKLFDIETLRLNNELASVKYTLLLKSSIGTHVNYYFGLSTKDKFRNHGYMKKLIYHDIRKNNFLLLESEDLFAFYSNVGYKKYNSFINQKYGVKTHNDDYQKYAIREATLGDLDQLNEIYEENLVKTNHIIRSNKLWEKLLTQYEKCNDKVYLLLDLNKNTIGYAFTQIKGNFIQEIFTKEDKDLSYLIQTILYKLEINNIKINFFSKENSNQYFMGYQWELSDCYINMLFN
ncbi:MAG: phosphatidylglycerol lysyltransferase domain-containing protein [Bacilli bacterium]